MLLSTSQKNAFVIFGYQVEYHKEDITCFRSHISIGDIRINFLRGSKTRCCTGRWWQERQKAVGE
jgi:hypothetical protein